MTKIIESSLSLASTSAELAWLYLQLWTLRAEIYAIRTGAWVASNPDEATATFCGLVGAYLLARNGRWAGLGWLAFLASNAFLIHLALRLDRPGLVLLQAGFTFTSLLGLWTWVIRPWLTWDDYRGDFDGNPALFIKRLASWRGRCIDLHKMVTADMPECFHTHPARAIRVILWGGYTEEVEGNGDPENCQMDLRDWYPLMVGRVEPELSHRIAWLHGRVSYSLWLRGRKTHDTQLRGAGWPPGSEAA